MNPIAWFFLSPRRALRSILPEMIGSRPVVPTLRLRSGQALGPLVKARPFGMTVVLIQAEADSSPILVAGATAHGSE